MNPDQRKELTRLILQGNKVEIQNLLSIVNGDAVIITNPWDLIKETCTVDDYGKPVNRELIYKGERGNRMLQLFKEAAELQAEIDVVFQAFGKRKCSKEGLLKKLGKILPKVDISGMYCDWILQGPTNEYIIKKASKIGVSMIMEELKSLWKVGGVSRIQR